MRGTAHIGVTVIIANLLGIYVVKPMGLIEVALFSIAMFFVAIGSIAPDIDIKHSLIRKWWAIIPRIPIQGVHLILGSIYGFKHRGVMHSLIGWASCFGVIGCITAFLFGKAISMAAVAGFSFGYLMHLIEDAVATKTKISWIPCPRFMESWNVGLVVVLLLMLVPMAGAENHTIEGKSFEEMDEDVNTFLTTLFWFAIKVVVLYAGLMALATKTHKSISATQGIILALVIVYVLPGVLKTMFT